MLKPQSPIFLLPSLLPSYPSRRGVGASVCDFIIPFACLLHISSLLASSSSHIPFCPFPSRLPEREARCLSFHLFHYAFLNPQSTMPGISLKLFLPKSGTSVLLKLVYHSQCYFLSHSAIGYSVDFFIPRKELASVMPCFPEFPHLVALSQSPHLMSILLNVSDYFP